MPASSRRATRSASTRAELGESEPRFGTIKLVYPQIEDGRVVADAVVDGLGDYFVSERIRVWVSAGERVGLRRAGRLHHDAVRHRLRAAAGRGRQCRWTCRCSAAAKLPRPRPAGRHRDPVRPEGRRPPGEPPGAAMNLGLSGRLTQATIRSPLTPLFLLAALARRPDRAPRHPARGGAADQRADGRHLACSADGLKAPDAVELVTKPLEAIVKAIDGVEHVYSQTQDDRVMVTARFLVGTKAEDAILRVHEKIRANIDRIPIGIPEPLIVGRGINDVAIVVLTLSPKPEAADALDRQGSLRARRQAARRADQGRQRRPQLHLRRQPAADPRRARSREARALRRDAAAARRQGARRQPLVPGRPGARRRRHAHGRGRPDAAPACRTSACCC